MFCLQTLLWACGIHLPIRMCKTPWSHIDLTHFQRTSIVNLGVLLFSGYVLPFNFHKQVLIFCSCWSSEWIVLTYLYLTVYRGHLSPHFAVGIHTSLILLFTLLCLFLWREFHPITAIFPQFSAILTRFSTPDTQLAHTVSKSWSA